MRKDEKEAKKKHEEEEKEKEEQAKKDHKENEFKKTEFKPKEKSEAAENAKKKMKTWLEEELASVKEAIRVRKEVAVVRGSVEANRVGRRRKYVRR